MLIYLSEESLNSLFKVLNETSVSGSYDEKVNRLKRSGVLSDSQDFTCHQTRVLPVVGSGDDARMKTSLERLQVLADLYAAIRNTSPTEWEKIRSRAVEMLMINGEMPEEFLSPDDLKVQRDMVEVIHEYSYKSFEQNPETDYERVLEEMLEGKAVFWATDVQRGLHGLSGADLKERAKEVLANYYGLGISLKRVANEQSEKLADFFPDGSYNYTFIMFPTVVYPNGDAGKGTCQITSQYDVNTQGLVQKLLNQNYQSYVNKELHRFLLRTLDIYGNNRSINSIGSSTTGSYIINENTCTILSKGYSATSGEVTNFKYTLIKTGIGFISTTYIRNDDGSETLRRVLYYTKV